MFGDISTRAAIVKTEPDGTRRIVEARLTWPEVKDALGEHARSADPTRLSVHPYRIGHFSDLKELLGR